MRRLLLAAAVAAISSAALAGPVTDAAQFRIGVATVADVEARLGAPQTTETDENGVSAIRYAQTRTHVKPASFVPIVGLFAGGATGDTSVVTYKFKGGVLSGVETSETKVTCRATGSCR